MSRHIVATFSQHAVGLSFLKIMLQLAKASPWASFRTNSNCFLLICRLDLVAFLYCEKSSYIQCAQMPLEWSLKNDFMIIKKHFQLGFEDIFQMY